MGVARSFNRSRFGQWVNSRTGRMFRLGAGVAFVCVAAALWGTVWGTAALAWSVLPLSAAAFDVCWISAALGGPIRSRECVATR